MRALKNRAVELVHAFMANPPAFAESKICVAAINGIIGLDRVQPADPFVCRIKPQFNAGLLKTREEAESIGVISFDAVASEKGERNAY